MSYESQISEAMAAARKNWRGVIGRLNEDTVGMAVLASAAILSESIFRLATSMGAKSDPVAKDTQKRTDAELLLMCVDYVHPRDVPPISGDPIRYSYEGIGILFDDGHLHCAFKCVETLHGDSGVVAIDVTDADILIYTRVPHGTLSLVIDGEEWPVSEMAPIRGEWKECGHAFVQACVIDGIKRLNERGPQS